MSYLNWSGLKTLTLKIIYFIFIYFKNILIGADQFINTILAGHPDETISSRVYRWCNSGICKWPRKIIDSIFWFDKDHCEESYKSELDGKQLPPELRSKK